MVLKLLKENLEKIVKEFIFNKFYLKENIKKNYKGKKIGKYWKIKILNKFEIKVVKIFNELLN